MISIEAYRIAIGCFKATLKNRNYNRSPQFQPENAIKVNSSILSNTPIFYALLLCVSMVLMIAGDVEQNPGPVYPDNVVSGSFNQGNPKFIESAGKQCICNAVLSICYSFIKLPRYWSTWDMDRILDLGDHLYNLLGFNGYLALSDIPDSINLNNTLFQIKKKHTIIGQIEMNSKDFIQVEEGKGSVFIAESLGTAFFKTGNKYYLFDSHARDSVLGLPDPDGKSVLMRFESKEQLEKYIRNFYVKEKRVEKVNYELLQVEVFVERDALKNFQNILSKEKYRSTRKRKILDPKSKEKSRDYLNNYRSNMTPEKKKKSRDYLNNYRSNMTPEKKEETRNYLNHYRSNMTPEKKEKSRDYLNNYRSNMTQEKKEETRNYLNNYRSTNMTPEKKVKSCLYTRKHRDSKSKDVKQFKKLIKQGPFFICVICNRTLYKQSVIRYDRAKYDNDESVFNFTVDSFDGRKYICKTCHSKLIKGKIPCQAVNNDLKIFELPDCFSDIRKLEKTLIGRRLLFKKITIMPKGQSPKMKGAICNVPIQADDICNILPRGMDNNGIVQVALKKKMTFKSNVILEAVRPNFVRGVLMYLKENNRLYSDININLENIPDFWIREINNNLDDDAVHFVNESDISEVKEHNEDDEEEPNPLDQFRLTSSETAYVPELAYEISDDSNITIAPGENRQPLAIICDENCEVLAHPWLFPTGKFGYKYERSEKLSPCKYFNQRLLNYKQNFASDSDYIFFAQSLMQHLNLNNSINIAMKKIKADGLTAGELSQNFKQKITELIATDEAFNFMNTLKATPAYWKKFLFEVIAMVKQLGLPTYFMTLSCADLRWNELVEIISKLNGVELTKEEIENLNYFERTKILNSNPVLLARHFQYRVENFFKYIVLNGTLGKVTNYAIRVEFQVRGSPHVHCLLWVENAPVLEELNDSEYVNFVDNVIKCELPNQQVNPDLFKLVKTYQTHSHSKSCRKYKNKPCRYSFGKFFCNRTIIAEPISDIFTEEQKEVNKKLTKELLDKVQNYINENLNPKYRNMSDSSREDYDPPKSINEILDELEIDQYEYYGCLGTSLDEHCHIHFKRAPDSCFTNNYFEEGLIAWEANIDIQPVLNYYKAVAYMCAYLSKTEDESTEAMKQAAKEAHEIGKSALEKMKAVSKAYRTHREMSIQEAVSIILPEIWLRKTWPTVTFANSNLPENRYRVCRNEDELANLPDDDTTVFKRNMLDRYMDRPNSEFKNGAYEIMENLCYAEFLSNYVLDVKKQSGEENENDYQPEILDEISTLLEDRQHLPQSLPLMNSKERLKLRKTKCILRYHVPNHLTKPEAYAHHLLFMFYPFRNESDLASGTYTEKLLQPGVLDVINTNKQVFEPYADVVDAAFVYFNIHNNDSLDTEGQQENDDVRDEIENEKNIDTEEIDGLEENIYSGAPSQTPIFISDDELNEKIRSLNKKQRQIFDYINKWARETIKSARIEKVEKPEPFHIFLTGSAGCGKSHLLTTIKLYLQKALSYGSGSTNYTRLLMLAPTGVAAVNIDGSTIHSALGILPDQRSGKCVAKLSDKKRSALRQKYSELQVIIIDEISMVSNKLLLFIHQRLCDIFGCVRDIPFAGISVIACGDFHQLPPIQQRPVFAEFYDSMLNISHCWRNFKIAELTEVMRQKGDQIFIDLLNNVRTGDVTNEDIQILKSREITDKDQNYPKNAIHIWAENALVNEHNERKLKELPGIKYEIQALDKVPENVSENMIQKVYQRSQMDTGGLAYNLVIKIHAKVMLTTNLDVEDKLCNGQIGTIEHLEFNMEGKVKTIYLKLEDADIGNKTMNSDSYGRNHKLVPIKRIEKEIKIRKNSLSSPVIKRLQFPLVLSWACTVHKVQGKTFPQIVFGLEMLRQRRFNAGQVYVALSRVTSLAGLFITGNFQEKCIVIDQRATEEYECMRENYKLEIFEYQPLDENYLSFTLLNVRSLNKHLEDICCDTRLMQNDLIFLTETQLLLNDYFQNEERFKHFKVILNNVSQDRFSNLALAYAPGIVLYNYFEIPGASLYTLRKPSYLKEELNVILIYRKNNTSFSESLYSLQHLESRVDKVHVVVGDFNTNALQSTVTVLSEYMNSNYKIINTKPTHISGSLLDHVYVHKTFLETIEISTQLHPIYFSDHDAVLVKIKELS